MQVCDLSSISELASALLAPLIATAVAYIAYQQWRTNLRREERESRSLRLDVYRRVKALLREVDYTREISQKHYSDFCEAVAEADFLFPESLREWLGELETSAAQWIDYHQTLESVHPNADQASIRRIEADMEGLIDSLQNAHCVLREKFEAHMK